MDSVTKPVITHDQLVQVCETYLGTGLHSACELKDGWFNAAFLLVSSDGQEAVVKVAPPASVRLMRYEKNLMHAEVEALRIVRDQTIVPVPDVIGYDTSHEIIASDYFLTNKLSGRPLNLVRPELNEESEKHMDRQVGRFLTEIHRIKGIGFGTYNDPSFMSWEDAFLDLMNGLREDASDLDIFLPGNTFDVMEPHRWALSEVQVPTLVHWDLWDGNIFADAEAGTITGLIDFERVLWADPLIEHNLMELRSGFLETYGSSILDTPGAGSRRLLYNLYLYLIMVVECRFRHFAPEHEDWCRAKLGDCLAKLTLA